MLGKKITLEKDVSETDVYGRLLRYVYVGDLFINAELIRLGYAREVSYPPDIKYSAYFRGLEQYALASKLGIHNEPKYSDVPVPEIKWPEIPKSIWEEPLRNIGEEGQEAPFKIK